MLVDHVVELIVNGDGFQFLQNFQLALELLFEYKHLPVGMHHLQPDALQVLLEDVSARCIVVHRCVSSFQHDRSLSGEIQLVEKVKAQVLAVVFVPID